MHWAYPCTSACGLLSPWLPFKPTVLFLISNYILPQTDCGRILSNFVSDSFLSHAPSDSTPFLPGHLFITSAVGGERVRRCQPKTFRSMSDCPWGVGTLSPYRKNFTKGINNNYYNFDTWPSFFCF